MNLFPLIDAQIDRGTAANQLLVWNATTQRFNVTLNPSAPASGIFGHLTRDDTFNTLAPAVAGDTLRFDAIGLGDGTDDDLIQLALNSVNVNGDLAVDGDLFVSTELGGVHGVVLGANALGYMKVFSTDDMFIGNRNNGKAIRFEQADSVGTNRAPLVLTVGSNTIRGAGNNNSSISTVARLFSDLLTGTGAAGTGAAFSMRAQAGAVQAVNTGYYAGRLDNVGSGTEVGALCISPDWHASALYSTAREFCVTAVAADEILVSMTKGNLLVSDGNLNVNGNTRLGDTTAPTHALEVAGLTKTEGGRIVNTTRITGNTTLDSTHHHVFCDTDGGSFTVTLPAGVDGTQYIIVNTGSNGNIVTVTPDGSENLLGMNVPVCLRPRNGIEAGDKLVIEFETTEHWH